MGRVTWNNIKTSKRFYVSVYRLVSTTLLISLVLNGLLTISVAYKYFTRPERNYYATFGGSWPLPLTPIDGPNRSSIPLLADDPGESDNVVKTVPQ